MPRYLEKLALGFTLAASTGCAARMPPTYNMDTCVLYDGDHSSYSESSRECTRALWLVRMSTTPKADGTPDVASMTMALNYFATSDPKLQDLMKKAWKQWGGMTPENLDFKIKQLQDAKDPIDCRPVRTDESSGETTFQCTDKSAPTPSAAASAPKP